MSGPEGVQREHAYIYIYIHIHIMPMLPMSKEPLCRGSAAAAEGLFEIRKYDWSLDASMTSHVTDQTDCMYCLAKRFESNACIDSRWPSAAAADSRQMVL